MASREFSRRNHESDAQEETPPSAPAGQTEDSDSAVDSLLDEIDDVLETNAESFVSSFVQKGGQ